MRSYTESTLASVQQWPRMSLLQWAQSMIMYDQVPDFLRVIKVIPALKHLADQSDLYSLIDSTQEQRMELLKLAKINSQTFEEALDKAESAKLLKSMRTSSQKLNHLITGKLQIMSVANLENSTKKVVHSQVDCFDLFDAYLEKLSARDDRIDAFKDIESTTVDVIEFQKECFVMFELFLQNTGARKHQIQAFFEMTKILRSSFAWFLNYQKSIHSSQIERLRQMKQAQEERKRPKKYIGGEYGGNSERVLPKRKGTGISNR